MSSRRRWVTALALTAAARLVAVVHSAQSAVPPQQNPTVSGTGFVLSSSYIATNAHVIKDATRIEVQVPNHPGRVLAAIVVQDVGNDLAILRADGLTFGNVPIAFANPASVKVGDDAFALGYPLGEMLGTSVRLSTGTVDSLFGIRDDPRTYQVSNPVQPGNSGGPLFNRDGELIGVIVAQLDAKAIYQTIGIIPQNVNFAIKGALLKDLVDKLREGEEIERRPKALAGLPRARQIEILTPFVVQVFARRDRVDTSGAPSATTAAATTPPTSSVAYRRPASATARIELLDRMFAFYYDAKVWNAPTEKAGSLTFANRSGDSIGIISYARSQLSFDLLKEAALKAAENAGASPKIVAEEYRTANGLKMLVLEIAGEKSGTALRYFDAFYSDATGTVQLSTFAAQNLVGRLKPDFDAFLSGLEKVDAAVPTAAPSAAADSRVDYEQGLKYLRGDGVSASASAAVPLFQKACDAGVFEACQTLGFQYANGNGIDRNDGHAVDLYRKACDGGNRRGCANLAYMKETGRGIDRDLPAAAALYQKACDAGDMYGCSNLSAMYTLGSGVARDDERAFALAQRSCDGGYMIGCRRLATAYERGRGTARDEARAIGLYQRACDGRDWVGCDDLGRMYADGRGVAKDDARAVALFANACDGAYASGCSDVARMYADGRGVAKDAVRAAAAYQKACTAGNTTGCARLASMYEFGDGVDKDVRRAIELYQAACKANDQASCAAATRLSQQ